VSVRVGIGLTGHPFADASEFWDWIDRCEASPLDSFWQSDRLVSREPLLESISTMAALAGRTRRLKFGMSVTVVSLRDPLVLAKELANIDYLSGGRLLPAFGIGPPQLPEWRATGRSPQGRGRRSDEALEIMARLWSEEDVSFEGEFYRYQGVSIAPRPVQQPLPLWIGGHSPGAIRRTARLGTGWLAGLQTAEQVGPVVESIRHELQRTGRTIDPDHYGAGFSFRFGSWDEPVVERTAKAFAAFSADVKPDTYFAIGDASEIVRHVHAYCRAGISKFVLRPLATNIEDLMSQTQRLIDEVIPAVHD
jgi:probable F420-dependent oxidoreductase